jgi:hypothetical protein
LTAQDSGVRVVERVLGVDVGASLEEQLDNVDMAAVGGK